MFNLKNKREVYRVYLAHTIHGVALSVISIYIPIYLLNHGYSLSYTIFFFVIFHLSGLLFLYTVLVPLMNNFGLLRSFKLHYPLQIIYLLLLNLLNFYDIPILIIAVIGGISTFIYYIPLNILLIKHSAKEKMGSDISKFVAVPKIAKVAGPLLSAVLIPFIGFWPVFVLAMVGLVFSFLPLANISKSAISVNIKFKNVFQKLRERKTLFLLEGFDNVLEESEWFWGIFVFLVIGSLSAPGIVGGLEALGGAIFAVAMGKYANKKAYKLTFVAALGVILVWGLRIFVQGWLFAYTITLVASFVMTLFLVSYFTIIYKDVKDKKEDEFLILREIPTVLGRMMVFGVILLVINDLRVFFFLPILISVVLMAVLVFRNKKVLSSA